MIYQGTLPVLNHMLVTMKLMTVVYRFHRLLNHTKLRSNMGPSVGGCFFLENFEDGFERKIAVESGTFPFCKECHVFRFGDHDQYLMYGGNLE
jgi:hypothetical protein